MGFLQGLLWVHSTHLVGLPCETTTDQMFLSGVGVGGFLVSPSQARTGLTSELVGAGQKHSIFTHTFHGLDPDFLQSVYLSCGAMPVPVRSLKFWGPRMTSVPNLAPEPSSILSCKTTTVPASHEGPI